MTSLLVALGVTMLVATAAVTVVVCSPVVITVDPRQRHLRIRWLKFLEFQRPLPGGAGPTGFYIFCKPVPLAARETAKESKSPKPPKKLRRPARFLMRCLGNSSIRRKLAQQISRLFERVFRSVELAHSKRKVSLPGPALNGMLAGALASVPRRLGLCVNFENNLLLELRLHPHRILKAILLFAAGL